MVGMDRSTFLIFDDKRKEIIIDSDKPLKSVKVVYIGDNEPPNTWGATVTLGKNYPQINGVTGEINVGTSNIISAPKYGTYCLSIMYDPSGAYSTNITCNPKPLTGTKARQAIESLYKGRCSIYQVEKMVDPTTKRTVSKWVLSIDNEPCRLSFETKTSADYDGMNGTIEQRIKLFLRPELRVLAGSRIVVTQNGVTTSYKYSGRAAVYTNHQEILLELENDKG